MKRKPINMIIVCVAVFTLSVTGLVVANKMKSPAGAQPAGHYHDDGTFHADEDDANAQGQAGHYHDDGTFHADEDGTEEDIRSTENSEMRAIAEDLGMDLDKIEKEGKTLLKKDTDGRVIDNDTERLYLANYMIKYILTSKKGMEYYKDNLGTDDTDIIADAVALDVAKYMNAGYGGDE